MDPTRRLVLELDVRRAPLQGRIGPEGAQGRPFVGYTQLVAAIEAFNDDDPAPTCGPADEGDDDG